MNLTDECQLLNPFTTEARFSVLNAMAFSTEKTGFSGERVKNHLLTLFLYIVT